MIFFALAPPRRRVGLWTVVAEGGPHHGDAPRGWRHTPQLWWRPLLKARRNSLPPPHLHPLSLQPISPPPAHRTRRGAASPAAPQWAQPTLLSTPSTRPPPHHLPPLQRRCPLPPPPTNRAGQPVPPRLSPPHRRRRRRHSRFLLRSAVAPAVHGSRSRWAMPDGARGGQRPCHPPSDAPLLPEGVGRGGRSGCRGPPATQSKRGGSAARRQRDPVWRSPPHRGGRVPRGGEVRPPLPRPPALVHPPPANPLTCEHPLRMPHPRHASPRVHPSPCPAPAHMPSALLRAVIPLSSSDIPLPPQSPPPPRLPAPRSHPVPTATFVTAALPPAPPRYSSTRRAPSSAP